MWHTPVLLQNFNASSPVCPRKCQLTCDASVYVCAYSCKCDKSSIRGGWQDGTMSPRDPASVWHDLPYVPHTHTHTKNPWLFEGSCDRWNVAAVELDSKPKTRVVSSPHLPFVEPKEKAVVATELRIYFCLFYLHLLTHGRTTGLLNVCLSEHRRAGQLHSLE